MTDGLAGQAWLAELTDGKDGNERPSQQELLDRLREAERLNGQLQEALDSRIVIEQAKGVLAERYGFGVDRAFEVLRRASRASRIRIHLEAALVVSERSSPVEIEAAVLHLEGQALGD